MLLRRVTEHVRTQNWTAVVIDFVIVVVGILMAFQVTEWAAQRQNDEVRAEYLSQLLEDLNEDAIEAERIRGAALLRMAAIEDLFAAIEQEEHIAPLNTDEWAFDAYEPFNVAESGLHSGAILNLPRFIPANNTFSAIVSNGDFKLLDSPSLVRQIQRYYGEAEEANELEGALWMTFENVLESRFRNGLSIQSTTDFDDLVGASQGDSRMRSELEAYWIYSGYQAAYMNAIKQLGTDLTEAIQAAQ